MRKTLLLGALAALGLPAHAQDAASPVGKWTTLDDKTGKPMTVTEVYVARNGTLAARVVENLGLPANCARCSGEYKGKPVVGMVTLWDLRQKGGSWGDGSGYKPSEDTRFKVKSLTLVDGGRKLEVTGCKAVFCRTATWVRAN